MKKILIVPAFRGELQPHDNSTLSHIRPSRSILEAPIVIVKGITHFKCIKNRWGNCRVDETEKIPNFLLTSYLMRYAEHFTKEELMEIIAIKSFDNLC